MIAMAGMLQFQHGQRTEIKDSWVTQRYGMGVERGNSPQLFAIAEHADCACCGPYSPPLSPGPDRRPRTRSLLPMVAGVCLLSLSVYI